MPYLDGIKFASRSYGDTSSGGYVTSSDFNSTLNYSLNADNTFASSSFDVNKGNYFFGLQFHFDFSSADFNKDIYANMNNVSFELELGASYEIM